MHGYSRDVPFQCSQMEQCITLVIRDTHRQSNICIWEMGKSVNAFHASCYTYV